MIYVPQEVWDEVTAVDRPFGVAESRQARADGWLIIRKTRVTGIIARRL